MVIHISNFRCFKASSFFFLLFFLQQQRGKKGGGDESLNFLRILLSSCSPNQNNHRLLACSRLYTRFAYYSPDRLFISPIRLLVRSHARLLIRTLLANGRKKKRLRWSWKVKSKCRGKGFIHHRCAVKKVSIEEKKGKIVR